MINERYKNFLSKNISNLKYYLFYQFFIKKVDIKTTNEIHVFCQGESLTHYDNLTKGNEKFKPDIAILANFEKNNLVDSKLKKNLKSIPLVFVANITEPVPYFSNINGMKLFKVFIGRFVGNYSHGTYKRTNCRLNKISNEVSYMPEELNSFYNSLIDNDGKINIGIMSLLIACYYKPKKIKIFGLDFYETEYFDGNLLSDMTAEHKNFVKNNSFKVKNSFIKIVQNFKNINFEIYTKSSIVISEKNIEIIKL
ncbi:hypothetical protein [Candidatus Pelagibacter sp.]|uniref:hypothetical protein n=1 Tax=Candidatus Pelagibacter sp. TaxID=2024849 RepID=UPI003F8629DB